MSENSISRRRLLGTGLAATGAVGLGAQLTNFTAQPANAAPAEPGRGLATTVWDDAHLVGNGALQDGPEGLVIGVPQGRLNYTDPHKNRTTEYEYAAWLSPKVALSFGATELIASWNALTPVGTWVQVNVRGTAADGRVSRWFTLANWTSDDTDADIARTSVDGQSDALATAQTDTVVCADQITFTAYEVEVKLLRPVGATASPALSLVALAASTIPAGAPPVSQPERGLGRILEVPTYSQEMHKGHYPQYNGGGEAWCSPTSTAMVLDFHHHGPPPEHTGWVDIPGELTAQVDHAARFTYDHAYEGTGNWPFNTAYAASHGMRAHVSRLGSLNDVGGFIEAGQPVVISISFTSDQLGGAGYGTQGHLLTIVGFTADGDVVCNDPASHLVADNAKVRVTYRREQFEPLWLARGGTAYLVEPR